MYNMLEAARGVPRKRKHCHNNSMHTPRGAVAVSFNHHSTNHLPLLLRIYQNPA
jgi:hypothetical protein